VIERLLAKRPEERWPSAVALAQALDDVAAAIAPPVRPRAPIVVRATVSPPALIGADAAIETIAAALDRRGPPGWVLGAHGARAGGVVAGAVRRHQLARAAAGDAPAAIVSGRLDEVARALGVSEVKQVAAAIGVAGPALVIDASRDDRAVELARVIAAATPVRG